MCCSLGKTLYLLNHVAHMSAASSASPTSDWLREVPGVHIESAAVVDGTVEAVVKGDKV